MEYQDYSHILAALIYIVFCTCFVFSMSEFKAAGLTIENIFGRFIKDEEQDFVLHHIERMCYTLMFHTLLPFGYVLLHMKITGSGFEIFKLDGESSWGQTLLALYAHASILIPMMTYIYICHWKRGNFHCHPIREKLQSFVTHAEPSWFLIAVGISNEFRRHDKLILPLGSTGKLVVTQSWIIKVSLYDVTFAQQSDSSISCVESEYHSISPEGAQNVQYLRILVTSQNQRAVQPFSFRINASDFHTLNDRLSSPIIILPHVSFHKSRLQQFLEVFREFIASNPVHSMEEDPELCIGCMTERAEVKLERHCVTEAAQGGGENPCGTCQCRPMWCLECMGKWFALRQDQANPNAWMSAKCSCPMCRATFCLLDVCPVMKTQ